MFTYLRQPKHIRFLDQPMPVLPAPVAVTFYLAPGQLFGVGDGPVRVIRRDSALTAEWDANTDRHFVRITPGFKRLVLTQEALDGTFSCDGNEFTFHFTAESDESLIRRLQYLQFALPPALSAVLPDPVYITRTEGTIGSVRFRVEHVGSTWPIRLFSDDFLAQRVRESFSRMTMMEHVDGLRLLAATRYSHVASRLLAAGYSRWEFMAETLLNYSKTLEVLFGDSRDDVRRGLQSVGVSQEETEGRFVPVTLLRDMLDVAHPRLAQLDQDRLQGIYLFLLSLEGDFQELLSKVATASTSGAWRPAPIGSVDLDARDLRTVDRILEADASRRAAKAARVDA